METWVTLEDIQTAQARIRGVALRTPLLPHPKEDGSIFFKPESFQPIGSFKLRGAYNRLAELSPEQRAQGVIAYSSGNHAQGVAYAAQKLGAPAVIVMPDNAPAIKVDATRFYGAEVVLYNAAAEKREEVAARLMEGKNWTLIPPFNDYYVIAGQGTIGLEILEDFSDVELVLVPVGGGGLISGIATAIKSLNPDVKIIGVEPDLANDAQQSFQTGKIVEMPSSLTNRTIADGTRTTSLGEITFAHVHRYVDDILTVSEAEIREAVRDLALTAKMIIEPSGALPYAFYRSHRDELPSKRNIVMVLSGGNIDPVLLRELLDD